MRIATFSLAICALAFAGVSQAAITSFDFTEVEQTEVAGFRTFDLSVTGTGQLTGIQMLAELSAGMFYQEPSFGGNTPPNGALIGVEPKVEFDTFIGLGGATDQNSLDPIIPGGAVNLGGEAGLTFSDTKLDITWAPPGADPVNDPNGYMVGRLSVSEDAEGMIQLLGSTFQEPDYVAPAMSIAQLLGGGGEDPIAVGDPVGGSMISLQDAFNDLSGVLPGAIMLTNDGGGELEITDLVFSTNDSNLFSAQVSDADPLKIDLFIDVEAARQLPLGTQVGAGLEVVTNGGSLFYELSAVVPEPSSVALAGLAMVGLVGFCRRK